MLTLSAAMSLAGLVGPFPDRALAQSGGSGAQPRLGEGGDFRADMVREKAQALAQSSFEAPADTVSDALKSLNYDQYRNIRYRPDAALWKHDDLGFEAQFFHLGSVYESPVTVNVVADGVARPILFTPDLFEYGHLIENPPEAEEAPGFAGFRLHSNINRDDFRDEFAVFQGASYFRGVAAGQSYGLSARGLAIATADRSGEEFPSVREFWIEQPQPGARSIVVHALLDSPSTTGAYRFTLQPGPTTVMDVEATLFPRDVIDKVGLAPLTSMFYFAAHDRVGIDDFRPSVHDSDGLLIWNGGGERLWRPVINPRTLQISAFLDNQPKGFGLMQRERGFANFHDLEARYENRPSLWVEPVGDWGGGAVILVEIPTDSEAHDNIVAFWRPAQALVPGETYPFTYRLHWGDQTPLDNPLAEVRRTMIGLAGAGTPQGEVENRLVVVEFDASGLRDASGGEGAPEIVALVNVGPNRVEAPVLQYNPQTDAYRVSFELGPDTPDPSDLRCVLTRAGEIVSEIWTFRWTA
ncbi:MAG TPA: glucan biosynthesis protein [Saliniramus sp.]|nr:glucan biosynthesis protein [Saliniramus sp.]